MTSLASTSSADYARAVRAALGDLASEQVHAIVDGLDEHLAEIAAEGTTDLIEALGSPVAYAAELRSAAALPPVVSPVGVEPIVETATPTAAFADVVPEPVEPRQDEIPHEAAAEAERDRWAVAARITVGATLALLAVVLIRKSQPLNGVQIVLGAAGVSALWLALRWMATRGQFTEPWSTRVPLTLAAAALVGAVLLGAELAQSDIEVRYVEIPPPATVSTLFAVNGSILMPDLSGHTLLDAVNELSSLGLVAFIDGRQGVDDVPDQFVVRSDPAPGTEIVVGGQVTLFVSANFATSTSVAGSAPTPTSVLSSVTTVEASPSSTVSLSTANLVPRLTVP